MAWPLIPVQIHIATDDDAGNWADAIAHSPRLNVSEFPALPDAAQANCRGAGGGFPPVFPARPAAPLIAHPHASPSSAEAQPDHVG